MSVSCAMVRLAAPTGVPESLAGHVGSCLTCQAELARSHRMLRGLASLRGVQEAPPRDLAAGLAIALAGSLAGPPRNRIGTAGRILAASAVGATAGMLAMAARKRRTAA